MSKIELELIKATGAKPKAKEPRNDFLKRVMTGVQALADDGWNDLSEDAQGWYNRACKLEKSEEALPDFPDIETPSEAGEEATADDEASETSEEAETSDDDRDTESEDNDVATKKKTTSSKAKKKAPDASAKTPVKAKTAKSKDKPGTKGTGYKGHREGSRKAKVHEAFDKKGAEAAREVAVKEGIAAATATSWISAFKKSGKVSDKK